MSPLPQDAGEGREVFNLVNYVPLIPLVLNLLYKFISGIIL